MLDIGIPTGGSAEPLLDRARGQMKVPCEIRVPEFRMLWISQGLGLALQSRLDLPASVLRGQRNYQRPKHT